MGYCIYNNDCNEKDHSYEPSHDKTCNKCHHYHISQPPIIKYSLHDLLYPTFQAYIALLDNAGNKINELYWIKNENGNPVIYTVIKLLLRLITSGPIGSLYQYNLYFQLRRFSVVLLSDRTKQSSEYLALILLHLHNFLNYIYNIIENDKVCELYPPPSIQYSGCNHYASVGYNKDGFPKIITEIMTTINNIASMDSPGLASMFHNYYDFKAFVNMQNGEALETDGKLTIDNMHKSQWFHFIWITTPILCDHLNTVINHISSVEEKIYNTLYDKFEECKKVINDHVSYLQETENDLAKEQYNTIIQNEITRLIKMKKREKEEDELNSKRWDTLYKNLRLKGQPWEETDMALHYKLSMKYKYY